MKGILGGNDDPEMGLESPLLDEDFGDGEGKEYRSPFMMKTKKEYTSSKEFDSPGGSSSIGGDSQHQHQNEEESGITNWVGDMASQYSMCLILPRQDSKMQFMKYSGFGMDAVSTVENMMKKMKRASVNFLNKKGADEENANKAIEILSETGKELIYLLRKKGYEIFAYDGCDGTYIVLLLTLSLKTLRITSERRGYGMKIDPVRARRIAERGNKKHNIGPIILRQDKQNELEQHGEILHEPYQEIYLPYSSHVDEDLYARPSNMTHPFDHTVTLRCCERILVSPIIWDDARDINKSVSSDIGGIMLAQSSIDNIQMSSNPTHYASSSTEHHSYRKKKHKLTQIHLASLINCGEVLACFPLHEPLSIQYLKDRWLPWRLPSQLLITKIGQYFGFRIALFVTFQSHWIWGFLTPSILGIVVQILRMISSNSSSFYGFPVLPILAIFVVGWFRYMCEYWKVLEFANAVRHGMVFFEKRESPRSEYSTEIDGHHYGGPDSVTGKHIHFFPVLERQRRSKISKIIVIFALLVVLSLVFMTYLFRSRYLFPYYGEATAQNITAGINALQVLIGNILIDRLVSNLCRYENHRTDTEFFDSYISKVFLFLFVNSYSSFLYMAFIAGSMPIPAGAPDGSIGECGADNCMTPLTTLVVAVFSTRVAESILYWSYQRYFSSRDADEQCLRANGQFTRPEYELFMEYMDPAKTVTQMSTDACLLAGYVCMFICALPIVPLLCSFCFLVDQSLLRYNLLHVIQRPMRIDAEDIGYSQDVLHILGWIALPVNAGLFLFTSPPDIDRLPLSLSDKLWIFIIFCTLGAMVIVWFSQMSNKTARHIIQAKRNEYFKEKLVDLVPDKAAAGHGSDENDAVLNAPIELKAYPSKAMTYDCGPGHGMFLHDDDDDENDVLLGGGDDKTGEILGSPDPYTL